MTDGLTEQLNLPSAAPASDAPVLFQVTITDLAGQSVVVDTHETMLLIDLYESVGAAMKVAPYLLRLVLKDQERKTDNQYHTEQNKNNMTKVPRASVYAKIPCLRMESILDPRNSTATVQSSGIEAGSELTVVRRSGFVLDQPGVSRYNADYYCTVHQVREAGWFTIELDFTVVGDGSLGALQDA
eukprot:5906796-Amphidinium_carterae.1